MLDQPKRRFWRVHLSTMIVIVLVANILFAVNFRVTVSRYRSRAGQPNGWEIDTDQQGFPFTCRKVTTHVSPQYIEVLKEEERESFITGVLNQVRWDEVHLLLDAFFALVVLGVTATVCEYLIRRRKPPA